MSGLEEEKEQPGIMRGVNLSEESPVREMAQREIERMREERQNMMEAARMLRDSAKEIDGLSAELLERITNDSKAFADALDSGSLEEIMNFFKVYDPITIEICKHNGAVLQKAEEILKAMNRIKLALSKE